MGHGHAVMGATGWVALTATVPGALGWMPLEPAEVALGAVVTAGAALLPDADHHSGTIAHSLPPFSRWFASWVGRKSGGHRHGTHSFLGVAIAGLLALALTWLRVPAGVEVLEIGAWFVIVPLVAFAAKSLRLIRGWFSSWAVSLAVAAVVIWGAPGSLWWLPVAVVLGCLIHIMGDAMTVQGVPLFWPKHPRPRRETVFWKYNGYMAVPVLGTAGSIREWIFELALTGYTLFVLAQSLMQMAA